MNLASIRFIASAFQSGTGVIFSTEKELIESDSSAHICHIAAMEDAHIQITPKLLDGLYTDAMLLADEARFYFDRDPAEYGMSATTAVAFSCESLKVTTRLMHSIAWLLGQKALMAGEIEEEEARSEARQLGYAPANDDMVIDAFPKEAQHIIRLSEALYYRLERLGNGLAQAEQEQQPEPLAMLKRLENAF